MRSYVKVRFWLQMIYCSSTQSLYCGIRSWSTLLNSFIGALCDRNHLSVKETPSTGFQIALQLLRGQAFVRQHLDVCKHTRNFVCAHTCSAKNEFTPKLMFNEDFRQNYTSLWNSSWKKTKTFMSLSPLLVRNCFGLLSVACRNQHAAAITQT